MPVAPNGLQLGYVWQKGSQNLYPILGVTGAVHYGSSTLPADGTVVTAAATSSAQSSWALVINRDGSLHQWDFPASTSITLAAGLALDSAISLSPSGTSAAVISPSAHSGFVLTGLPAKPVAAAVSLPAGFIKGSLAIGDTGILLVGINHPGTSGVEVGLLSPTRSYSPVTNLQAWGGAAFVPGSQVDAAVLADGASAQLTYVSGLSGASAEVAALPVSGLLQKPAGVAISPDGKAAFVADAGKPQLVRVPLGSSPGEASAVACACTPQQLTPLTPDGVYAITANTAGQPDWVLDARTAQPRTFFIPALAGAPAQTSSVAALQQSGTAR